ncbi:MAG: right-handed parallel beta-helix repeat-containing protein [candidate division WOR-3 bacterium]
MSCSTASDGGGIWFLATTGSLNDTVYVQRNVIDSNYAGRNGGGIYYERSASGFIVLRANRVCGNIAHGMGGGAYLKSPTMGSPPDGDTIADNLFAHDSATTAGGGICADATHGRFRRNITRSTSHDGVWVYEPSEGQPLVNLGDSASPGYNVFTENRDYDVVLGDNSKADFIWMIGNYWGSLDDSFISERIRHAIEIEVRFNPIAASGKWFNVGTSSLCRVGVIVTGDLEVCRNCSLVCSRTLEFLPTPDCTLPGGDPKLCDLILRSGSRLRAEGPLWDSVRFIISTPKGASGTWYGIRGDSWSSVLLSRARISNAYCGVHATGLGTDGDPSIVVSRSLFTDNYYVGLWLENVSAIVDSCRFSNNGVAGIACSGLTRTESLQVHRCRFSDNWCDVFCSDMHPSANRSSIRHNSFERDTLAMEPELASNFGVYLTRVSDRVKVDSNTFYPRTQAAVLAESSNSPVTDNTVETSCLHYGLWCRSGSSPRVRYCMFNSDAYSGGQAVFADRCRPDLGDSTANDPGRNAFSVYNQVWVRYYSVGPGETLKAEYNTWGSGWPGLYPEKLVGDTALIDYTPWLDITGGGGQSAHLLDARLAPELGKPCPNPFGNKTTIRYAISQAGPTQVKICDLTGRVVRMLVNQNQLPGRYSLTWNRTDDLGRQLAEGVYFVRLSAPGFEETQKALVTQ